ncbi:MAG: alpha/beta hydrolase [Planctomycetota bacterium]
MKPWQRILLRTARALAIGYLVVVLLMTFLERWLVYPAPPLARSDWTTEGTAIEEVEFASADGTKLHGWLVETDNADHAIVYFHGNGEQVADNGDLVEYYADRFNATVLVFDYRGYGYSEGKPNEKGVVQDGLAAQRWLAERTGREPGNVVLVGRSIGGGVAVACAAELGAKALVLQSTFSRLTDAAAHHYPWLPVRLAMRNRYDSVKRIAQYDGPLLQSHGTKDFVVPLELGRRLYDAAPGEQKRFIEFRGGGHNDPQPPAYYDQLAAFLDELP